MFTALSFHQILTVAHCPKIPRVREQFGTEMLLWCLGYYTDINRQIEKLVAQCVANI